MAASVVIESELGDGKAWRCVGMGGNGMLLAVSFTLQELRRAEKFAQLEDAPRWVEEKKELETLKVCLESLSQDYNSTLGIAFRVLDSKLRGLVGYPPPVDFSVINLNYWHDALTYLRCHLAMYDFLSGVPFALGDGPLDMGTVVLYGQHVFVVTEEQASGLPPAPCKCTLPNFLLRQCYSQLPDACNLVPGEKIFCDKCQQDVFVDQLLHKETSSAPQSGAAARVARLCVLCNQPANADFNICPFSCHCLVCALYLYHTESQEKCTNCGEQLKKDRLQSMAEMKSKCLCGSNINLHTDGYLCNKGHILCGKCCFVGDDHYVYCCLCKSVTKPPTAKDQLVDCLRTCSTCENRHGTERLKCGHLKCETCKAAKVCKRCAAISR